MYINHIRINSTANIKTMALQIYITQGKLRPNVPDNDYIVYEGKLYHGNELYDLCIKVQNEITKRAIDGLD